MRTLLRRFRHAIGQTYAKHGHLRPGYTAASLDALLGSGFIAERHRTYSRFFSELVDTLLNWAIEGLGKKGSAKGMVVTGTDVDKHRKLFLAYSIVYPAVWAITRLDGLIPWVPGYMLIASYRRRSRTSQSPGPRGPRSQAGTRTGRTMRALDCRQVGGTMSTENPHLVAPEDRQAARSVAEATMDPSEFLWSIRNEPRFNTAFKSTPGGIVSCHAPCHLRAQSIGFRSRDLL